MRPLLFFSVFFLIMAAINFYSYRRFLIKLSPPLNRFAALIPALLMLGISIFAFEAISGAISGQRSLLLITSASIGISFVLFIIATFYDLSITLSKKVPLDQERRRFIKLAFDFGVLLTAFGYLWGGLVEGMKVPEVKKVRVRIPGFSAAGLRLVQLTDVHVGRTIRREFVQQVVERVNALQPDLVVITGDLTDLAFDEIEADLQPLAELNAPVYFITGNHEYFHGIDSTIAGMSKLNITPLLNEHVRLESNGTAFNLIGVTDLVAARMNKEPADFAKAYAGLDPSLPCIVLAHQPKAIHLLEDRRCDLMLSGHTHGGQIFPFGVMVIIDQPYLAGLYQHNANTQIYVSRGTGYWGPPLRIMAPSEISELHIVG